MTTNDNTGKPVFWVVQYRSVVSVSTYRRIWIFFLFLVIMKSVTADGSLRSPTGGVEGLNPAPHIHEQMTTSYYGYDIAYNFSHNNIMLEHNAMNNMGHCRAHERAQHAVLSTLRAVH